MFRSKKWLSLVLCFLVAITAILTNQSIAAAEDAENTETKEKDIYYVLVLDCTQMAASADEQEMRKAAAKMFVDLIPIDNAKLAVFVIGAEDKEARKGNPDLSLVKSYQLRDADNGHIQNGIYRMDCIYQVWDFDRSISTPEERETLKKIIDGEYSEKNKGKYSDIHCGVYAALDTLKDTEPISENACILLVSDEFFASYQGHKMIGNNGIIDESYDEKTKTGHTMWDDIENTLSEHPGWILNWVDLGNRNSDNREKVDKLCRINKGEKYHDFSISQLPEKIAMVVSKYGQKDPDGETITLDSSGSYNYHLEDFIMLTEANIVVTGNDVEKVRVSGSSGKVIERPTDEVWYSDNFDPENEEHFLYSAVKLIRPSSGQWTVNVKGQAGTQVYIQKITTLEPDIKLHCPEANQGEMIGVGTQLHFTAKYWYGNKELYCGENAYKNYLESAELHYTLGKDTETHPVKVYVEGEQYKADFVVQERGTYHFSFYVRSNDFKTGYRYANSIEVNVENHAPKAIGTIQDLGDAPVGSTLDGAFKIVEHFEDDDNETLKYHLECTRNGRDVEVEYEIQDDGFLKLTVPAMAGVYDFRAYAEDLNGAKSEELTFSLNAVNKPTNVLVESPCKKDMILNAPDALVSLGFLPKDKSRDYIIKASDLFEDPDHQPLMYTFGNNDRNEDGQEIVLIDEKDNNTWTVKANSKGKATVTFFAADPSNEKKEVTYIFTVKSVGTVLGERYWWIPVLIALIVLAIAALLASRRVRGSWSITVQDSESRSGCTHSFTSLPSSRDQRLKKTKVSLLSIVKCAVRKEDCVGEVQTNLLKDKVIVFKGSLALGKGVKFIYTSTPRIIVTLNDTVLTKSGKYILKKNQTLDVDCKDVDDSLVLNVQASFH